jgi:hypothetical protein
MVWLRVSGVTDRDAPNALDLADDDRPERLPSRLTMQARRVSPDHLSSTSAVSLPC